MGWKLERLEFCGCEQLKPNEERDVTVNLREEKRAVIHGTVLVCGKPVKDAAVKLFTKKFPKDDCDTCELVPITFTFTDECGQFLFKVDSHKDYIIKVFYYEDEKPCPPKPCKPKEKCTTDED